MTIGDEHAASRIANQRLKQAVPWVLLEAGLSAASAVALMIVIARLIGPVEYGKAIAAISFVLLVELVSTFGVPEALVQRSAVTRRAADTAFWTGLGLGLCGSLASLALAPLVTWSYGDPDLFGMVAVYGFSCILAGVCSVPLALLTRRMRARALMTRTLLSKATSLGLGISLAYAGYGAWSIIIGALAGSAAAALALWMNQQFTPSLQFDRTELRRIARFGGMFSLDTFIAVAAMRISLFLIGAMHGYAVLGYFAFALRIVDELGTLISSLVSRFGLAYFTAIGAVREQAAQSFRRGTHYVASIAIPIYIGLVAIAPAAVPLVFGRDWEPAIPIVQVFGIVYAVMLTRVLAAPLVRSIGAQWELLVGNIITSLLMIIMVTQAMRLGTVPLAIVLSFKSLISFVVSLFLVRKYFDVGVFDQIGCIARPMLAAGAMLACISLLGPALATESETIRLVMSIFMGAAVFHVVLAAIDVDYADQAARLIRRLRALQ